METHLNKSEKIILSYIFVFSKKVWTSKIINSVKGEIRVTFFNQERHYFAMFGEHLTLFYPP